MTKQKEKSSVITVFDVETTDGKVVPCMPVAEVRILMQMMINGIAEYVYGTTLNLEESVAKKKR